jgi:hypothetical protein
LNQKYRRNLFKPSNLLTQSNADKKKHSMSKEKSNREAILKRIIAENSFTPETSFFRYTSPKHLVESQDGRTFINAFKNPMEMIIDIYHGGHSLIANNIGPGLAFTLSVEEDYNSNDKLCVEVKLEDILDQNGLIYEVTSVPEYVKAFFFSLPDKKIKVEVYDKNVKR